MRSPRVVQELYGKVYRFLRIVIGPNRAGNLFAFERKVLYAREDAAPVTPLDRLVNRAGCLDVNAMARNDLIIDATEKIEYAAALKNIRI